MVRTADRVFQRTVRMPAKSRCGELLVDKTAQRRILAAWLLSVGDLGRQRGSLGMAVTAGRCNPVIHLPVSSSDDRRYAEMDTFC